MTSEETYKKKKTNGSSNPPNTKNMTIRDAFNEAIKCHKEGNLKQAQHIYSQIIQAFPKHAESYHNLGSIYFHEGNLDEALPLLEKALELKPDYAQAHKNLAVTLKNKGQIAEAEKSYRDAIAYKPDYAEAYHSLVMGVKYDDPNNDDAKAILELLEKGGLSNPDCAFLHFAISKIYDDCQEWDKAFEHCKKGNDIKAKYNPFDRKKYTQSLNSILNMFSEEFLKAKKFRGHDSELPVFIVGMPRSGTTLVEQIISSHPKVYGAGELDTIKEIAISLQGPVNNQMITEKAQRYIDFIKSKTKEDVERISDKMPNNFNHLGLIATLFPNARVIHCDRNAMDTCLSNYFQCFVHGNEQSYDLSDLGYYYNEYKRAMAHWQKCLPLKMMEINYEELVANKEEKTRELIEFLGLEWDDKCLQSHKTVRDVRTASAWQVRQPVHNKSVNKYKHYEKHLKPLKESLEKGS